MKKLLSLFEITKYDSYSGEEFWIILTYKRFSIDFSYDKHWLWLVPSISLRIRNSITIKIWFLYWSLDFSLDTYSY